jgi:hypothetical protein
MGLTKVKNRMISGAPVNVRDFGAVGDGVTDDTAAIQAAFVYAGENAVVISPGGFTYAISDQLNLFGGTLYNFNKSIIVPVTGLDPDTQSFHPLRADYLINTNVDFIEVCHFEIDGSRGGFDFAISGLGASHMNVHDNYIHDIGTSFGVDTLEQGSGINIQGKTASLITNIHVHNNTIINIKGWGDLRGDFIYCAYFIGALIDSNYCKYAHRMGIVLTSYSSNFTITNNTVDQIGAAAIDLESNHQVNDIHTATITGNVLTRFGNKPVGETGGQFFGLDVQGSANKIVFSNNTITNGNPNNIAGRLTTAIYGINEADSVVMNDNVISGVDAILKNYSGNSMDNFTFSGNTCNSDGSGIDIAIGVNCIISSNIIEVVDGFALTVFATDVVVISDNIFSSQDSGVVYVNILATTTITGGSITSGSGTSVKDSALWVRSGTDDTVLIATGIIFSGANGGTKAIRFEDTGGIPMRTIVRDNLYVEGITTRVVNLIAANQSDDGGVQVFSPNGTEYLLVVDNAGTVSATLA